MELRVDVRIFPLRVKEVVAAAVKEVLPARSTHRMERLFPEPEVNLAMKQTRELSLLSWELR